MRFSSIELPTVTDGIIEAMHRFPARFCNYFHLPLQSGCDKILKEMNRHYTTQTYQHRVEQLRAAVPGIGIFADVIAGYPTETEEDFQTAYQFIKQLRLSGLHVFSYSPRPGTPAAALPQLPAEEIKRRADKLRALDQQLRADFAASLVGTEQTLFMEDRKGIPQGITANFQTVFTDCTAHGLVRAKITRSEDNKCFGQIIL